MLTPQCRTRKRIHLHNGNASRQPLPPRMGNLRPVPLRTSKQRRVLYYAHRMEHHRSYQILILCLPVDWLCAWLYAILEVCSQLLA
jgi:hypothetical protein